MLKINIPQVVGRGYGDFWRYKGRYRVVKGGRGSKKSCTAALWFIVNLMRYPEANLLVVRRFFNGHKDSTYAPVSYTHLIKLLAIYHKKGRLSN